MFGSGGASQEYRAGKCRYTRWMIAHIMKLCLELIVSSYVYYKCTNCDLHLSRVGYVDIALKQYSHGSQYLAAVLSE